MSTWSGWQADLLNAAGFPNSAANRDFLSAWHAHANSNCALNPVDISKQTGKWTACKHLDAGRTANNYGNRQSAEAAFKDQVFGGEFVFLNSGFFNSSLTVATASSTVIQEISLWGSSDFANYLRNQTGQGGGGGGGGKSPGIHKGWSSVRKSVNSKLPSAYHDSSKLTAQALRSLSRARKVKI